MRILLVGGGSGGHITPLLAVARELKKLKPRIQIGYVIEKGSQFYDLPSTAKEIDDVFTIRAGKFRRYHSRSLVKHLLDVPTNLKNTRDLGYVTAGISQSRRLLKKFKPDVIFIKGGFVGVPVGVAASQLGVPYFTHDSDTIPGLANKLIAKKAFLHTVGMPAELYNYPKDKTKFVGIPLHKNYKAVSTSQQTAFRAKLGIDVRARVLCITGGSLGAQRLNEAVKAVIGDLLSQLPDLIILHQTGSKHTKIYNDLDRRYIKRVRAFGFSDELYVYTGAADVILARAGATTIAELAVQQKSCIFIPNPDLTGGQQSKNARFLIEKEAAEIIYEDDMVKKDSFTKQIVKIMNSKNRQNVLKNNIAKLAKPNAASEIAKIIINKSEGS